MERCQKPCAVRTRQAADLFNQPSELRDQTFNSVTSNVIHRNRCSYFDIFDKIVIIMF